MKDDGPILAGLVVSSVVLNPLCLAAALGVRISRGARPPTRGVTPKPGARLVWTFAILALVTCLPRVNLVSPAAAHEVSNAADSNVNDVWSRDLISAVRTGNFERVDALLATMPSGLGERPLIRALLASAGQQDSAMFRRLVDAGADWRGQDGSGALVMSTAAKSSSAVLRELLELGADPNGGSRHTPPIIAAARNPDQKALRMLLDAGADLDVQWHNTVPLTATMAFGPNPAMLANLDLLISVGADVNAMAAPDPEQPHMPAHTPLFYAVGAGRFRFAERLLAAGADPNQVVYRYLPDGTTITLGALVEAERQTSMTGSNAMENLLRSYGAERVGDPLDVIERAVARNSLRAEDHYRKLTDDEASHLLSLIQESIDGLPMDVEFEKEAYATRQHDGAWVVTEHLAAWPQSENRRRSHTVTCTFPPNDSGSWECKGIKARYRQRLGPDQPWFTVSGDISETRIDQLIAVAHARIPGCPESATYLISAVSEGYVVIMENSVQLNIIETDNVLTVAKPLIGDPGCFVAPDPDPRART